MKPAGPPARPSVGASHAGTLVVNADDWGRDRDTTARTLDCILRGSVSSVSAMVFMADSEWAAEIVRERGIDAGLHLNFTTAFTAPGRAARLTEQQQRLSRYLRRHRFAPALFHPGLVRSFEYVVAAQRDEFCRLYGAEPARVDGHHHMHLSANVLCQGLLPRGVLVRRNFSFQPGEKSLVNRLYRRAVDRSLAKRYRLADFLFSLTPFEPRARLQRILSLAHRFVVEVETHPVREEEYQFLMGDEVGRWIGNFPIAPRFAMPRQGADA